LVNILGITVAQSSFLPSAIDNLALASPPPLMDYHCGLPCDSSLKSHSLLFQPCESVCTPPFFFSIFFLLFGPSNSLQEYIHIYIYISLSSFILKILKYERKCVSQERLPQRNNIIRDITRADISKINKKRKAGHQIIDIRQPKVIKFF